MERPLKGCNEPHGEVTIWTDFGREPTMGSFSGWIVVAIVTVVCGCADSGGQRGGSAGGPVSATQTITGSTIQGSNSNVASPYNIGGAGGTGGQLSQSIPVNLALDPAAFTSLFGHAAPITNPTASQASKAKSIATDTNTKQAAERCLELLNSCIIGIK